MGAEGVENLVSKIHTYIYNGKNGHRLSMCVLCMMGFSFFLFFFLFFHSVPGNFMYMILHMHVSHVKCSLIPFYVQGVAFLHLTVLQT